MERIAQALPIRQLVTPLQVACRPEPRPVQRRIQPARLMPDVLHHVDLPTPWPAHRCDIRPLPSRMPAKAPPPLRNFHPRLKTALLLGKQSQASSISQRYSAAQSRPPPYTPRAEPRSPDFRALLGRSHAGWYSSPTHDSAIRSLPRQRPISIGPVHSHLAQKTRRSRSCATRPIHPDLLLLARPP